MGMGKSTVAGLFSCEGVPVWSADEAVSRLYGPDGMGTKALREILPPEMFNRDGVDRKALRRAVARDRALLKSIEGVIHPLVHADRQEFIRKCRKNNRTIAAVEIPLLFESGSHREVDTVIVVTAPADVQKSRIIDGRNLSELEFESLLANQMPESKKRKKADYLVESVDPDQTRDRVREILGELHGS